MLTETEKDDVGLLGQLMVGSCAFKTTVYNYSRSARNMQTRIHRFRFS